MRTSSRKISIKYVRPVVVYKIIDEKSILLHTLDGKLLVGLFQHKVLKPAVIRTSQGNVATLCQLIQVSHMDIKLN